MEVKTIILLVISFCLGYIARHIKLRYEVKNINSDLSDVSRDITKLITDYELTIYNLKKEMSELNTRLNNIN